MPQLGVLAGPSVRGVPTCLPDTAGLQPTHPTPSILPPTAVLPTLHVAPTWREVETQPEMFQQKKRAQWFSVDFFWLEHFQPGSRHIRSLPLSSAAHPS